MPVRSRKQSDSPAATLYSPPETWTSNDRALRNGTTPGSRRWTRAPRERKSRAQGSWRTVRRVMRVPGWGRREGFDRPAREGRKGGLLEQRDEPGLLEVVIGR